ncbi:MAG: hypothetical protein DME44_01010 [Verrucomicrobia bacterium]|nr:MAG: hypothetical protein DME44_01010 [Verrucomicrobiota bacterium]
MPQSVAPVRLAWPPSVGHHQAPASSAGEEEEPARQQAAEADESDLAEPVMTPTRSSFLAKWKKVSGASGYRIDVSTSPSFDSYVAGYRDLDAADVTNRIIGGLMPGIRYYYRVRPYDAAGTGSNSETMLAATANTSSGLVINPTFDSSITSNPRSNAIQATIISTIQLYQSLFSDPITVSILFRFSSTSPRGDPLGNMVGESFYTVYPVDWNSYINSLKADATTQNDISANATLPSTALSTNIITSSANGRAIGLDTPPSMFANGTVSPGGPYDGIVTLNSNQPLQFARPIASSNYDARRFTEHEIDEVLGLGSHLDRSGSDLRPQDLFNWSNAGVRNTSSSGTRYFSIDRGTHNIVSFNQDSSGDFGDWFSQSCPQSFSYVQNAFTCKGQTSDISMSSPEGVNLDVIGYTLILPSGLLQSISTRLQVGIGGHVLIGGFVIGGSGGKQVVLRALGPTLAQFGVSNVMQNPTLELRNSSGTLLAYNDDWQQASNAQSIPANLRPPNSLESAILTTLNPGAYTAILRGFNNGTGNALVEVYDIATGTSAHLSSISTRGFVQADPDVMIAGLVVQSNNKKVIVRVLGPTLANFGIADPLADPTLEVRNGNGTLIGFNDNWRSTQEAEIAASGYAPPNDTEPAILRTVAPGNYTAIVRGIHSTIGVALVEIYTLN